MPSPMPASARGCSTGRCTGRGKAAGAMARAFLPCLGPRPVGAGHRHACGGLDAAVARLPGGQPSLPGRPQPRRGARALARAVAWRRRASRAADPWRSNDARPTPGSFDDKLATTWPACWRAPTFTVERRPQAPVGGEGRPAGRGRAGDTTTLALSDVVGDDPVSSGRGPACRMPHLGRRGRGRRDPGLPIGCRRASGPASATDARAGARDVPGARRSAPGTLLARSSAAGDAVAAAADEARRLG